MPAQNEARRSRCYGRRNAMAARAFPLQAHPIILPSGRVVRIFNLLSLTQSDDPTSFLQVEPSLRIQYATYISPDQPVERSAEAAEVIAYFLSEAASEHSTVAHAEICSTPAQAERRGSPEASFRFRRDDNGAWRIVANNRDLDHPPNER